MANYRRGRINDEMQKTLAEILREVKDPRVSGAFVSVTGVDVTPDLKYAKVYYSALQGDTHQRAMQSSMGLRASYSYIAHAARSVATLSLKDIGNEPSSFCSASRERIFAATGSSPGFDVTMQARR